MIHAYIARFQIAVDDASLVCMMYCLANLGHEREALPCVQLFHLCVPLERLASDQFHGQIWLESGSAFRGAHFVDLSNARVLQAGKDVRFLLKSPEEITAHATRFEYLYGHCAGRLILLGLIYDAHTSFAEQSDNPVLTDLPRQRERDGGACREKTAPIATGLEEIPGCSMRTDQGLHFGTYLWIVTALAGKIFLQLFLGKLECFGNRVLYFRPQGRPHPPVLRAAHDIAKPWQPTNAVLP
jgi:hypothetical protein